MPQYLRQHIGFITTIKDYESAIKSSTAVQNFMLKTQRIETNDNSENFQLNLLTAKTETQTH